MQLEQSTCCVESFSGKWPTPLTKEINPDITEILECEKKEREMLRDRLQEATA